MHILHIVRKPKKWIWRKLLPQRGIYKTKVLIWPGCLLQLWSSLEMSYGWTVNSRQLEWKKPHSTGTVLRQRCALASSSIIQTSMILIDLTVILMEVSIIKIILDFTHRVIMSVFFLVGHILRSSEESWTKEYIVSVALQQTELLLIQILMIVKLRPKWTSLDVIMSHGSTSRLITLHLLLSWRNAT